MRAPGAFLTLAAVLAVSGSTSASDGSSPACAGDWDTIIAAPARPWIFVVHLKPAGALWTGVMSVEGLGDLPLRDVRAESARVHFQLPPELHSMVFEGTLTSDEIVGAVSGAGHSIPTRLTRIVRPPAPANRLEAWQQDLDFAAGRLPEYDRSFALGARTEFQRVIAKLEQELPRRNDDEILVALSRAVALGGNAHTWMRLDPTRQGALTTQFPLRIWWFSDGAYVLKAAPQYRRALRCRVIAIGGHDVSQVREQVTTLFAGNDAWRDYLAPLYMVSPDMLYGLGLIPNLESATFTFEDAGGARFDLPLRAERIDRSAMADESWQDLSPLTVTGVPPWASALPAHPDSLPLYLRHPHQPYWFSFRPTTGVLYFQFNRAADAESGPSFTEFGDSLLTFTARHEVRALVVDLRLNSGGDLDVAQAFMKGLGSNPAINRRDRLFAIIGHCTFSAGLYHAAQLKQFTQATFVGEPVGDRLDFWAEGGRIVLPNSRAVIAFSNGFHRYSGTDYPQYRPYYEELSIPSLEPDIPTPTSSGDYLAGRDPALEAIEARVRR